MRTRRRTASRTSSGRRSRTSTARAGPPQPGPVRSFPRARPGFAPMPGCRRSAILVVTRTGGHAMKAAVVYESWFGNTRAIAEAVARGLGERYDVTLCSVDDRTPAIDELDLLVVGGPTQVHGLSSVTSRKAAVEQLGDGREVGIGARGFVEALSPVTGASAAAFDT